MTKSTDTTTKSTDTKNPNAIRLILGYRSAVWPDRIFRH